MLKKFLKPLRIITVVYIIGVISVAADIAQLTDFNLLDFLKTHSPQSYYYLIAGSLLLYFILVIIEFANARDIRYSNIFQHIEKHYPGGSFIDQKIDEEKETIRKSRFFGEFDTAQTSSILATRIIEGELSGGSDAVKCQALAWCSRFLSSNDLETAEKYLNIAKTFGSCQGIRIAEAFISSYKGDKLTALGILANLNIPLSRSASLMIVNNIEGSKEAMNWFKTVGYTVEDLESDGKYILLTIYLQLEQWEDALLCVNTLTDDDLLFTPILQYLVAITHLMSAVPIELRTFVINQVPFQAANFPLADSTEAIEARRKAYNCFIIATEVAHQFKCSNAAKICDEYALWLELRDPSRSEQGKELLAQKLRNPESALYLVRLGLKFGIKLDLEKLRKKLIDKLSFTEESHKMLPLPA